MDQNKFEQECRDLWQDTWINLIRLKHFGVATCKEMADKSVDYYKEKFTKVIVGVIPDVTEEDLKRQVEEYKTPPEECLAKETPDRRVPEGEDPDLTETDDAPTQPTPKEVQVKPPKKFRKKDKNDEVIINDHTDPPAKRPNTVGKE